MTRLDATPGFVYLVAFDVDVIKVGRTRRPQARLAQHNAAARAFGISISQSWVSPEHANWQRNERVLLDAFRGCGGAIARGAEYFTGVTWERAGDLVDDLRFEPFPHVRPKGPVLDLRQMAERLGLRPQEVYRMCRYRGWPYLTRQGGFTFAQEDVDFIERILQPWPMVDSTHCRRSS